MRFYIFFTFFLLFPAFSVAQEQIIVDDFDSYSTGDADGVGCWSHDGSDTAEIVDASAVSLPNSLYLEGADSMMIQYLCDPVEISSEKTILQFSYKFDVPDSTNDEGAWHSRSIVRLAREGEFPDDSFYFGGSYQDDSTSTTQLSFADSSSFVPSGVFASDLSANTWYDVYIEIDFQNERIRGSVDDFPLSDWFSLDLSADSYVHSVWLGSTWSSSSTFWYDSFGGSDSSVSWDDFMEGYEVESSGAFSLYLRHPDYRSSGEYVAQSGDFNFIFGYSVPSIDNAYLKVERYTDDTFSTVDTVLIDNEVLSSHILGSVNQAIKRFDVSFPVVDGETEYYRVKLSENVEGIAMERVSYGFALIGDDAEGEESFSMADSESSSQNFGFIGNMLLDLFVPSQDFVFNKFSELSDARNDVFFQEVKGAYDERIGSLVLDEAYEITGTLMGSPVTFLSTDLASSLFVFIRNAISAVLVFALSFWLVKRISKVF